MNRASDHHFDKPTSVSSLFNSRHGFWTWDLETGLVSLDQHCCRILGFPDKNGMVPQDVLLRRVHAQDLLRVMPIVEEAIRNGEPYRIEYSVLNSAEEWIWLESMGRVVEWVDGRPKRVAGVHTDITERIRVEQALAASQARQQALIASLPDLVFVIDSEGVISEYYPPGNAVVAYPAPEACIGLSYFAFFPQDIAHYITDSILVLIEDPTPLSADMSMEIDGFHRDFHITLSLLTDSNQWPVGYLCVARDITERKRIEQALSRSEERLALVLKGSGGAAWDWDLVKNEYWFAPRWWNMLGLAAEEASQDAGLWCRYMHEEDRPLASHLLDLALADPGKDNFNLEFRLRHKSGHTLRVVARGYVQRDGNGKPLRVAGINMELTQRDGGARGQHPSVTVHSGEQK